MACGVEISVVGVVGSGTAGMVRIMNMADISGVVLTIIEPIDGAGSRVPGAGSGSARVIDYPGGVGDRVVGSAANMVGRE
jgi:hypothetical protein